MTPEYFSFTTWIKPVAPTGHTIFRLSSKRDAGRCLSVHCLSGGHRWQHLLGHWQKNILGHITWQCCGDWVSLQGSRQYNQGWWHQHQLHRHQVEEDQVQSYHDTRMRKCRIWWQFHSFIWAWVLNSGLPCTWRSKLWGKPFLSLMSANIFYELPPQRCV